jgi:hypothetical protein
MNMSTEYRAKYHQVIADLRTDLAKGHLEDTFDVGGHKYVMHTLNEDEETWADTFVRTNSPASMISSRKAPRIAAAIKSIDGVAISGLFSYPDDMPKDNKQRLDNNPIEKQYWLRDQMLYLLADDGFRSYTNELFACLVKLDERRDEAIKVLPKP